MDLRRGRLYLHALLGTGPEDCRRRAQMVTAGQIPDGWEWETRAAEIYDEDFAVDPATGAFRAGCVFWSSGRAESHRVGLTGRVAFSAPPTVKEPVALCRVASCRQGTLGGKARRWGRAQWPLSCRTDEQRIREPVMSASVAELQIWELAALARCGAHVPEFWRIAGHATGHACQKKACPAPPANDDDETAQIGPSSPPSRRAVTRCPTRELEHYHAVRAANGQRCRPRPLDAV